jgi:hypothetical protein
MKKSERSKIMRMVPLFDDSYVAKFHGKIQNSGCIHARFEQDGEKSRYIYKCEAKKIV